MEKDKISVELYVALLGFIAVIIASTLFVVMAGGSDYFLFFGFVGFNFLVLAWFSEFTFNVWLNRITE